MGQNRTTQRITNAAVGEPMVEQEALTFGADGTISRRVGAGYEQLEKLHVMLSCYIVRRTLCTGV